jgi:hypothetical protein
MVLGLVCSLVVMLQGSADLSASPKPLKKLANSVECSTEIGLVFHGFSPY